MNANQESKLNMYRTVQDICNLNIAIITGIPALQSVFNALVEFIENIISAATNESLVISGIAIDKTVAKKNLCQSATNMAGLIFAYASSIKNNTLKQEVNFAYTDLFRLRDEELVPAVQNIVTAANTNLADLADYGVTAATISSLQAIIAEYSTAVPQPRSAKSIKEMYGKNLKQLFKDTDDLLKTQMDKLVANLKTTEPNFVSTYKSARVIIDPNKTTTQVKGLISSGEGETPVANATVQIIGITAATTTTDVNGNFIFKPVVHGTYQVTITAAGFQGKTITGLLVKLGQITTVDIQLIPVV
jgi:Carboxypeptidase regulatory-like domain